MEVHSEALLYVRTIDYFKLKMSSPLNPRLKITL